MPIRAENRARYPKEWPVISLWVRVCACWRCEWCHARQGEPHPVTGSKVVLTVAHVLNDAPEDVRPQNLAALCQRCHNRHDAPSRRAGIRDRTMNTHDLLEESHEWNYPKTSARPSARWPERRRTISGMGF